MGGTPKTGVGPPNGWFIMENPKTLLKWMIWGYHHFRKHPYGRFALKGAWIILKRPTGRLVWSTGLPVYRLIHSSIGGSPCF